MIRRRPAGLVAMTSLLVAAACSSDDDAASSTNDAVTTVAPDAPPSTGSARSAPSSTATSAPTSPSTSQHPTTSPPATAPTSPPTDVTTVPITETTVERPPYERLAAALPDAGELELPADWVSRELDPTVPLDDDLAADFDPFLGLLACADGVLREGSGSVWAERSIVGPTVPLDDGLLGVRMTIERESSADSDADTAALSACGPTGAQVVVEPSSTTIDVAGRSIEARRLRVASEPTAEVPFPSVFDYVVAHDDGTTATVLLYGLDVGQDWSSRTDEVAGSILSRAD